MINRIIFSRCKFLPALVALLSLRGIQSVRAAYPMADQVPADAVAYVGWAGAVALNPAYKSSDLGAFIDHSNLPDLARQYIPRLWESLAGAGGDKESIATLQKALPLLWDHPLAIYVSRVSILADGTPDADIALVCDAGADAPALQADIQQIIKGNDHLHVTLRGSIVAVDVNDSAKVHPVGTLATAPNFIVTMKSLQQSPAVAVYIDGKALLQKADESAAADPTASQIWPKIRNALGISDLQSFAMTAGFDGNNWMTASVMQAPAPRKGLLAVIEPKPVDPALLARVPATAGCVSVINFDVALLCDTIGEAMSASKQSDTWFHQGMGIATLGLGRPFRQQILGPLGPQWVFYSDSASHSVVMLNHPNDPAQVSDSFVSATFGLVNLANGQIPGATTQPVVAADQRKVKGVDITSAVTKYASPTFAVSQKILYFGLSADSVINSAVLPDTATGKDITHSPNFIVAAKRLGVPQFASFDYSNIPETAPAAYKNFGAAGTQISQVMSLFNLDFPKVELPPIEQLKMHLSPALSISWTDANGVYSRSISPFPGSTYLLGDPQQMMVGVTTVSAITAAVVPALERARASARSVKSLSNEHQLGLAVLMYATDNKGMYPPDLGSCIKYVGGGAGLNVFINPESDTKLPAEIVTAAPDAQAAWVNEHSDYQLLMPGKKISEIEHPSDTAILVPKGAEQSTRRVPVGFADGHCELCKPQRVHHLLHPDAPPENK